MATWTLQTEKQLKKECADLEKRIQKIEYLLEHGTVRGSQDEKALKNVLHECTEKLCWLESSRA
jgi:hypothetical protein